MAGDWYSSKPRTRFSKEHFDLLPTDARMIDLDQVLFVPYDQHNQPMMLIEVKPENAKEDFWIVTCTLAMKAGLPAARVTELDDGTYRVDVATEKTRWIPHHVGDHLTMTEWYEQVEQPLRQRSPPT